MTNPDGRNPSHTDPDIASGEITDADFATGSRGTGLSDTELTEKDRSESPGSESETAAKQADPIPDGVDDDIDQSQIRAVPGTGGPDDAGDIEVDPDDLNMPGRS
ncbi:hypothetical protein ASC59_07815 [Leifsonia sp. Root1293]|nr:hypothetical protein ASC59_07815 [Leifsonia sp. Root1293]KRA12777.1 hypothetical protein ASD61_07815 [Leifsonia sp. Root60]